MSELLRDVLQDRARDVAVPHFDPDDLVSRGSRKLTQRRAATVTAGVLAVGLAIGLPVALDRDRSDPEPAPPFTPEAPSRPLSYAEGRTLHVGDATVEADEPPVALDPTDDGVVFVTGDGTIWFTDGSEPRRIGETRAAQLGEVPDEDLSGGYPARRPAGWVVTDDAGALAAWFEYPADGDVDIVVVDTHTGREVARVAADPAPGCENCAEVLGLRGGSLTWARESCEGVAENGGGAEACRERLRPYSYDLETGEQVRLTTEQYVEQLMTETRNVVRRPVPGASPEPDGPAPPPTPDSISSGVGATFQVSGSGPTDVSGESPGELATYVAASGERVRFEMPDEVRAGSQLVAVQWLDDETLVLVDRGPRVDREGGPLLTCTIATERCEVTVPAVDGGRLLPGS